MKRREIRLLSQTFKHLRGRHDQRDHNRWPAGYQSQTYVPTGRRGSVMSARATGGLAGITQSETLLNQGIQQKIKDFQKERALKRLPHNFDVSPYKAQMQLAGRGVSQVKTFTAGNEVYYYRDTPAYYGARGFSDAIDSWFPMPGYYMPIVADSLSSAMGVDVAPVAQISNEGRIVTTALDIDGSKSTSDVVSDLVDELKNNYTPEKYEEISNMIEPHVLMALILGQGDGHYGNMAVINNPSTSTSDTKTIFGSFDHDFSGTRYTSDALVETFFDDIMPMHQGGGKMFSSKTEEILRGISKNIEWHPDISSHAKRLIMARIDALIQANEDIVAGTTDYNGQPVQEYVVAQLNQASDNINKMNRNPLFARDMANELQNHIESLNTDKEYTEQEFNTLASKSGDELAQEYFKQVYGKSYDEFQKEMDDLYKQIMDVSKKLIHERNPSKFQALYRKKVALDWRMNHRNTKNVNLNNFNYMATYLSIEKDATIKDVNSVIKEMTKQVDEFNASGMPRYDSIGRPSAELRSMQKNILKFLNYASGLAVKNGKSKKFAVIARSLVSGNPIYQINDFLNNPDLMKKFFADIKKSIRK